MLEASAASVTARTSDELVRFMLSQRVDGVIFDRPETAAEVQPFVDYGLPVVQLRGPHFDCPTATIITDPAPGTDAAIDHLVRLGHRRIAFLGQEAQHPVERARLDCFRAALARHGLSAPPELVRLRATTVVTQGQASTEARLALPERPTAIVTVTEALALGALRALYQAHLRVPDDVSVISTNDALAIHLYPPLTSISTPFDEIAEQSITLLTEQIATGDDYREPRHVVLPSGFVIRESTQALPSL